MVPGVSNNSGRHRKVWLAVVAVVAVLAVAVAVTVAAEVIEEAVSARKSRHQPTTACRPRRIRSAPPPCRATTARSR